ncbi:hypothetical protein GGR56DRAFT_113724 [Xylariaceae sp. FL0804]|nr:hypothetical protein GGR56DRAFT_113724 [Xylariaceae sp. FL0804]
MIFIHHHLDSRGSDPKPLAGRRAAEFWKRQQVPRPISPAIYGSIDADAPRMAAMLPTAIRCRLACAVTLCLRPASLFARPIYLRSPWVDLQGAAGRAVLPPVLGRCFCPRLSSLAQSISGWRPATGGMTICAARIYRLAQESTHNRARGIFSFLHIIRLCQVSNIMNLRPLTQGSEERASMSGLRHRGLGYILVLKPHTCTYKHTCLRHSALNCRELSERSSSHCGIGSQPRGRRQAARRRPSNAPVQGRRMRAYRQHTCETVKPEASPPPFLKGPGNAQSELLLWNHFFHRWT